MYELLKIALDEKKLNYRLVEWGRWVVAQNGAPRCVSAGFELCRSSDVFVDSPSINISDTEANLIELALAELKAWDTFMGRAIQFYYIPSHQETNTRELAKYLKLKESAAYKTLKDGELWLACWLRLCLNINEKGLALFKQKL